LGIFRNHTIIKDGALNLKQIEVLVPNKDYGNDFISTIEIEGKEYGRLIFDLTKYPIVNRTYINKCTTIDDIFSLTVANAQLEAKQKLVGYYLSKFPEELKATGARKDYTLEQIKVLENHGLDKNLNYKGVELKTKSAAESDSYQSRTMVFYLAGFSSVPKVDELMNRLNEGKKLTASLSCMNDEYNDLLIEARTNHFELTNDSLEYKLWLEGQQKTIKETLIANRNVLNVLKIAKLLSGDWFPELVLDDKGNYTYTKNGYTMIGKADWTTEYF
jgi:hypothetical protein